MLTSDQRWLLWAVGLSISRALIDDDGLTHYMASQCGGTRNRNVGPAWLTRFDTYKGKITGGSIYGDTRVTVTGADIRRFRKTIPADRLEELKALVREHVDEQRRTELWCRCRSREPHQDWRQRDYYHPTDAEYAEHRDIAIDRIHRERDCLRQALALDDGPVGQLELFTITTKECP